MTITYITLARLVAQAGFPGGLQQATMIAICDAESGRNPAALGVNRDDEGNVTSYDRGLCQINDVAHPDVASECAYDPVCALKAAFRISQSGMDFTPWAAYLPPRRKDGTRPEPPYLASMDAARVALDGLRLENQLTETIKQRNAAVLELREATSKIDAARQALA